MAKIYYYDKKATDTTNSKHKKLKFIPKSTYYKWAFMISLGTNISLITLLLVKYGLLR